jgi:hypothetical protein
MPIPELLYSHISETTRIQPRKKHLIEIQVGTNQPLQTSSELLMGLTTTSPIKEVMIQSEVGDHQPHQTSSKLLMGLAIANPIK